MSDALFGKKLIDRLDVATSSIIDKVIEGIRATAMENADFPTRWPIEVVNETIKDILNCPRMSDMLVDKLAEYDLAITVGMDNCVTLDIIDIDDDGIVSEGIILASSAGDLALANKKNKLTDVYNHVGIKISEEARSGGSLVKIQLSLSPINNDARAVKKLSKKLLAKGYEVFVGKAPIDIGARPDYATMKELIITWNK